MKTQKLIFLVMFFCTAIVSSRGQSGEKVTIQSNVAPGIFILVYKAKQVENVKISILNSKNELIFTESLKLASFSRPYNFNDQGQGDFKIIVEDKEGKTEKKISYTLRKVESVVAVTKIANAKNKYLLAVENKESDQIAVKILGNDKNVVHEEVISVNGKFAVVFNVSETVTNPVFEVAGSDGVWKTFAF
jgi:predicted DNA binding protein